MSTNVTWNGVTYSIPASGEVGWAALSDFLIALGTSAQTTTFQKFATRIALTSPVTVASGTDAVIVTDLTVAGPVQVNLPPGVDNQLFAIVDGKGDAHINNITITPNGVETINDGANLVINSARGAAIFVFKTGNWNVIARISAVIPPSGGVTQDAVALWNADGSLRNSKLAVDDTGATAATLTTIDINQTANRTVTIQDVTHTIIGRTTPDQGANRLTNKDLDDTTTRIVDSADTSIKIAFDAAGTTATTTTLLSSQTVNRTLTLPNATDTLVGTATVDTLTNKTLTAPTLTSPTITTGGLTMLEIATPANPAGGFDKIYPKSDGFFYTLNSAGAEVQLGGAGTGGSGEINAIGNPSGAASTAGWTAGTSHTVLRDPSAITAPLSPIIPTSLAMSSTAAVVDSATAGVYYTINPLAAALLNKKLKLQFYLQSPNNTLGTWGVSVYGGSTRLALSTDVSGETIIPSTTANLIGQFTTYFDSTNATSYTVHFYQKTRTSANTLYVTNVIVGPGIQPQGAVVGPPISFTPTTNASFGTVTLQLASYVRIGNIMRGRANFKVGTLTTSAPLITIPNGLNYDSSLVTAGRSRFGIWNISATGAQNIFSIAGLSGLIIPGTGTTEIGFAVLNASDASNNAYTQITNAQNLMQPNGTITFDFEIPISEWAGSGVLNIAQNDVEYAYNTSVTVTTDSTSFGYGPQGNLQPTGAAAGTFTKRVRFQSPVQVTDLLILEHKEGTGAFSKWVPLMAYDGGYGVCNLTRQNTLQYGIGILSFITNATDVDIQFGQYQIPSGAYGLAGGNWGSNVGYWRVKKVAGGAAVGFGLADAQGNSGLVNPYLEGSGVVYTGTFTPTLTNTTNIAASTPQVCMYVRVGKMVTVTGLVLVDPTSAGTATSLGMTLPIASNLTSAIDLQGILSGEQSGSQYVSGRIQGDTTNDRANFTWYAGADIVNREMAFTFTYIIK